MKIRPLQDRVVVRRMEEETTPAGGIVLPGSATEKPAQVKFGGWPGKRLDSGDITAGRRQRRRQSSSVSTTTP